MRSRAFLPIASLAIYTISAGQVPHVFYREHGAIVLSSACNVSEPCWVGDGWCDADLPGYNTPECGYDGGDCCAGSCQQPNTHDCGCSGYVCIDPVYQPTAFPTGTPSARRSGPPTRNPTIPPTSLPTVTKGTVSPTRGSSQTASPSSDRTAVPTVTNSAAPSATRTLAPTSTAASGHPSAPSSSAMVTSNPSGLPTMLPSFLPSATTATPSLPSAAPSTRTNTAPSASPTGEQSSAPSAVSSSRVPSSGSVPGSTPPSTAPLTAPSTPPAVPPSRAPTAQASSAPSSTSTVPAAAPACAPSHAPTSAPTARPSTQSSAMPTTAPSQLPVLVVAARCGFLMVNCTVPRTFSALPSNESEVIATSVTEILRQGSVTGNFSVLVISNPSGNAANFSIIAQSRRLRSAAQLEVWNVSALVTLQDSGNDMTSAALEAILNMSVTSGALQKEIKRQSLAPPPVLTLSHAVLCDSIFDTDCLQMVPAIPTVIIDSGPCARSSSLWTALYSTPQVLPWYMLWLGAQGVVWVVVGLRALAVLVSKQSASLAMLAAAFAAVQVGYLLLLIWSRWWYTDGKAQHSYACTEFAFLDHSDAPLLLLLMRGLIYPTMGALASVCIQRSTELEPYDLRPVHLPTVQVAVLCVVYMLVRWTDLLTPANLAFSTQLVQAVSGTVILAHLLVLLCGTRCRWTDTRDQRRARWVLRDLEVEANEVDFALVPVETSHKSSGWPRQQSDLSLGKCVPPGTSAEGDEHAVPPGLTVKQLVLIATCATLSILTSAPPALGSAISAYVLYSTGARIAELLLALQALGLCTLGGTSTEQTEEEGVSPAPARAPAQRTTAQREQTAPALLGHAPSALASPPSSVVSPPVPAQESAPPATVAYWRKPWAWMLAARDGSLGRIVWSPPARTVSHEHEEEVRSLGLVSLGQNSNSSNSGSGENSRRSSISSLGDSTDSGSVYFI